MNFFKKIGRPNQEEQMMIQAIEQIILEKGIPENEIPNCHSLDDLIELKIELESQEPRQTESLEFANDENQEQQGIEFEPLEENQQNYSQVEPESEQQIPESVNPSAKIPDEQDVFVNEDYDPFTQPVVERSYTKEQKADTSNENPEDELVLENIQGKKALEDLNPATKRKAAEQTADALLKGYAKLVPQPFKMMSKISESKVEKMSMRGEIDLSIEVSEGVSFEEFMRQANEQIDEIFEVEQETLDEIREPLIDVLMEQQLELTPTQRLTMAILSHLVQMFTVALKLRQQNNRILAYQQHLTHLSRVKVA